MIKLFNHALSRDDLRARTHHTDEYNTMQTGEYRFWNFAKDKPRNGIEAVSYTHLTLPTTMLV